MYQKIKVLCKEKGISVYRLEKDLGFSTGSVCKWDDSIPRADTLLKIANYFDKPVDYFIQQKGADDRVLRNRTANSGK